MTRLLVIPAAGRGSRLNTSTPKPLVHVGGRPMLDHLVSLYSAFVEHIVVVAHPSFAARIRDWAGGNSRIRVAEQSHPTGMLDAILAAADEVRACDPGAVWITWADQIGVRPGTVERLAHLASEDPAPALVLPTVQRSDPYIHFERDADGRIARLLQRREGDCMPAVGESDMGLFALSRDAFAVDLPNYSREVAPGTLTAERNFLPFVPWLAQRNPVVTFACSEPMEAVGVNTPDELQQIETWLSTR